MLDEAHAVSYCKGFVSKLECLVSCSGKWKLSRDIEISVMGGRFDLTFNFPPIGGGIDMADKSTELSEEQAP